MRYTWLIAINISHWRLSAETVGSVSAIQVGPICVGFDRAKKY